jgi:hypothetical protein
MITLTGEDARTGEQVTHTFQDHGFQGNGCYLLESDTGNMYWYNPAADVLSRAGGTPTPRGQGGSLALLINCSAQ